MYTRIYEYSEGTKKRFRVIGFKGYRPIPGGDRAEPSEHDFKQALKDIVPAITWSYIAEEYFNKSRSWFSQRMNGYHVNNKVATFTDDEIDLLSDSLLDLSERIKKSAFLLRKHRL